MSHLDYMPGLRFAIAWLNAAVEAISRADQAEALARQQAEEIGKLRGALERARSGFRTYADSVEGHYATKHELAADLRIQADLIDAALSKEEQPC